MDCSPPGSSAHEDFPGKNTGVGCHALLEGIFPTQGSNPGLIADRFFYCLSHQGSQRILEWVAYPFSRGSFQPRDWTRVSFIAGGFFTIWATREALYTLPCAKQVASRDLLCTVQEAPLGALWYLEWWEGGKWWSSRGNICTHRADSCHCTAESNRTLQNSYTLMKKRKNPRNKQRNQGK